MVTFTHFSVIYGVYGGDKYYVTNLSIELNIY